jgi:hypothetical protein
MEAYYELIDSIATVRKDLHREIADLKATVTRLEDSLIEAFNHMHALVLHTEALRSDVDTLCSDVDALRSELHVHRHPHQPDLSPYWS